MQKWNIEFHASPDMKFDLPIVFRKINGGAKETKNQN